MVVAMAIIRAQVIHLHDSGVARDNAVNTFHFNGAISDPNLATIRDALRDFYTADPGSGQTVGRYMSSAFNDFRIKLYDVTEEPSGSPLLESADYGHTDPKASATNLPAEVAACLSFEGTPEGGLIQRRRRGRVYIGPLNAGAATAGVNGVARVAAVFTLAMREAAEDLAADVDGVAEWVVYSRPYAGRDAIVRPGKSTLPAIAARAGTTVNIDRVWTDDAFDTQRRRGERATAKTYLAVV